MLRDIGAEVADEMAIPCEELEETSAATARVTSRSNMALVLGGDHSAAIGSMRGAAQGGRLGVIYIDAHPDVHTPETTLTNNVHGMVAALAMEHVRPEDFLFIGIKDFDQAEIEFIREHNPPHFTLLDIARCGLGPVMQAIDELAARTQRVWVSFDIDSIDQTFAPGVAMRNEAGLTAREALMLAQYIGHATNLRGIDIVELLPANDHKDGRTARLALALIARLLGHEWGGYQHYMREYTERADAIVRL
jgi:arginase